jgi:hypothetical protein
MKKDELAKLALLGLASGMLTSNAIEALQNSPNASNMLAKGCQSIAHSCTSSGGQVAQGCGGCHNIADKCGGPKGKCGGAIAEKCGGPTGACHGVVADRDATNSLTAPGPIPKEAPKAKEWNVSGQLIYEGNYVDGKRQGVFRHYDDKGSVIKQATYVDDKKV